MFFLALKSYTQDERFFREMFTGNLKVDKIKAESVLKNSYVWNIEGRTYRVDLNGDKNYEGIRSLKKDGRDFIGIYNHRGDLIFEGGFNPQGKNARVYKVSIHDVNPDITVLLFYYYEGFNKYTEMLSTGRIYIASIYKNNLLDIKFFPGPRFWEEFQSFKGHYHQRKYEVIVNDFDGDNIEDIMVRYGHSSTIMKYIGKNTWTEL